MFKIFSNGFDKNKVYAQHKIAFPVGLLQLFLKFLSGAQQ